jgi:hypothetical protein
MKNVLSVASLCFECVLSHWIEGNGGWRSQDSYNVTLLCKVTQSVAPGRGRGGATARWVQAGLTWRHGEMGGCCWAVGFTELGAREGNEWPNGGKASTGAGSITSGSELYWGFRFYDFCSVF